MALGIEQERRRVPRPSERTRVDPCVVIGGDASPRDQRDLMERPFFSLSKSPRTKPILYRAKDVEVQVFGMPEHGMATIWDADVLIWAASQIVQAENQGLATSRFFRFTPYQLLRGVGRPTGNQQYLLLKAALARLQSTVIATTIRHGEHWRQRLPGYRLLIERKGWTELLRILPVDPSTVPVNNPVNRLGRSGAKSIGRSGAALSAEQAHPQQLNLRPERQSPAANLESNRESNSSVLTRAHESGSAGAGFRDPGRGIVNRLQESRTRFTKSEPDHD